MSTPTIEDIVAAQAAINTMIAALTAPAPQKKLLVIGEANIELAPGELYVGAVLDADGLISHHLILLPGEAEDVSWQDATAWAEKAGGTLPTRQEQALLYANRKSEFASAWYWSSETHKADGSYAWGQYFSTGGQLLTLKSFEGRARAVRLIPLKD